MVAQPSKTKAQRQANPDTHDSIMREIELSIAFHREHPEQIGRRLAELDREWDIDRVMEAASSGLTLFGVLRGLLGSRRWLLLAGVVQGFCMQHSVQGTCLPMGVARRFGLRTQDEIELERLALKELRGDFGQIEDKQELDLNKLRGALEK